MVSHQDEFNFAIVPQRVYQLALPLDVKFKVLQPVGIELDQTPNQATPYVTVFRANPDTGPRFSISLSKTPEITIGESFLTSDELALVFAHIGKYYKAYLLLRNTSSMDTDELRSKMGDIDRLEIQK